MNQYDPHAPAVPVLQQLRHGYRCIFLTNMQVRGLLRDGYCLYTAFSAYVPLSSEIKYAVQGLIAKS